jgi:hypothetical protein
MPSLYPTTQATVPQLPQLDANQNPPRPTQMPAQPIQNPNNKAAQPTFNVEIQPFSTCLITPMPLQNIHLRLGKVVKPRDSTVVIEEEETHEQPTNGNQPKNIVTPSILTQTSTTPIEQPQAPKLPPYPERLAIEKPIVLPEFDLEIEL